MKGKQKYYTFILYLVILVLINLVGRTVFGFAAILAHSEGAGRNQDHIFKERAGRNFRFGFSFCFRLRLLGRL